MNMDYLKNVPIAVLGGGAVGKTCAADIKLIPGILLSPSVRPMIHGFIISALVAIVARLVEMAIGIV